MLFVQGRLEMPEPSELHEILTRDLEQKGVKPEVIQSHREVWASGKVSSSSLRNPLLLALAISPFVLLLPSHIERKGLGAEALFIVSGKSIPCHMCNSKFSLDVAEP
jgi:hypothetical protein